MSATANLTEIEYLGSGISAGLDNSGAILVWVGERKEGAAIELDPTIVNLLISKMRKHWPVMPLCPLCLQLMRLPNAKPE